MPNDRPDPGEFIERAQQMLRDLFGQVAGDPDPGEAGPRRSPEPSPQRQRENLTFALATRAVEALEDLALNVAAIRQRLERVDRESSAARPEGEGSAPGAADGPGGEPGRTAP